MNPATYIRDALRPGGTPKRYLEWVSIILLVQAMASILPSPSFYSGEVNLSHVILGVVTIIAIGANFVGKKRKIKMAYGLYFVGLALTTITISSGITSLSGIVFMLTWAMTLFVAERREYISFDLVTVFMVMMLLSSMVLLMFNPSLGVSDNWIILAAGGILTAIDIYLVYTDFGYDKNYYREYRKRYSDLQVLSSRLSEILSSTGKTEKLLWNVVEECVPFLGLEECVIYLYSAEKNRLIQVAAYGSKTTDHREIIDPLDIEPDTGIVGKAFETAQHILVEETSHHPDYRVDNIARNSELAVPIVSNGKVIGVIDSEHSVKGFFLPRHVQAFQVIASFCGIKISETLAKESIEKAETLEKEASHYRELDQLKNRFITNISHDLKTPLSLIKAPAMQIEKQATDEHIKKLSSYILKNTDHLLRVVGQLLQLNRVDKGLNELYLEEVKTESIFSKLVAQYEGLAEKDRINFKYTIAPVTLRTDSFRLEQIVHNLVHNAFRYTGANGEVEFHLKHRDGVLEITVGDNGEGISQELQARVFDRFFKADENNHEGTGIGLSLVKEYTESLKGTVFMDSEKGIGTTFTVRIPVESTLTSVVDDVAKSPEFGQDGKPVMLVVEDHADLNDFICSYFQNEFHCIAAFDGQEALGKMKVQTPDIIISDLMMPKMDGTAFVKEVKEHGEYGHIPVVVLSAKSQTESRIDLYTLGADNYLLKPFDVSELQAVVHNTFEQRKKVLEKFRTDYLQTHDTVVSSAPIVSVEKPAMISEAIELVLKQIDDADLNVKSLTQQMGIGRNRFQKEIKDLTGLSPVEFIRSVRLNEARKLLQEKRLSISEIAYSVGFNNLSYFTRSFKKEFGSLPSEVKETPITSSNSSY